MPGLSNPVVASDSSGVRVICDTSGAVWPSRPTLQPERKFGHVLARDFASGRGDWTPNPVPEEHGKKERPHLEARFPFRLGLPALPCRGFNAGRYPYFQKREVCQFVGKLLIRGIRISR